MVCFARSLFYGKDGTNGIDWEDRENKEFKEIREGATLDRILWGRWGRFA